MSNNILQINSNILKTSQYFVEFFDFREYTELERDFTMGTYWLNFLKNVTKFSVPLKEIEGMKKTNNLWFRNEAVQDSCIISVDNSEKYNIMNFITKGITAKNMDLEDLIYLGAIIKVMYIDNFGTLQESRLTVGRVTVNSFTDSLLRFNILPLNNILKGSTFEKHVYKYPTAAYYNYISLEQAFSNIYNVPHNIIDDYSYTATPFLLNKETYVPTNTQDIVIRESNLPPGITMYAEDTVIGSENYTHSQFFYYNNEPNCYVRLTEYDDNGDELSSFGTSTAEWAIWADDAYINNDDNFSPEYEDVKITLRNYQRLFRPFRVIIAGDDEVDAIDNGSFRTVRKVANLQTDFTFNIDYVDMPVTPESKFKIDKGDKLIYFELCGDVSLSNSTAILFEGYSHIFVYNLTKKVVYWDKIAVLVQSQHLPKQWLDLKSGGFISMDAFNYSSRSSITETFLSGVRPFLFVGRGVDRSFVYSYNTFLVDYNVDGQPEYSTRYEKQKLPYDFGNNDIGDTIDKGYLQRALDTITSKSKPKAIKFSEDGKTLYFVKSVPADFEVYPDETPKTINQENYSNPYEFPGCTRFCKKALFDYSEGTKINLNEYDEVKYLTGVNAIITEIPNNFNNNSIVLINAIGLLGNGEYAPLTSNTFTMNLKNSLYENSDSVNLVNDGNVRSINSIDENGNTYFCFENKVYRNNEIYLMYESTWKVLDYNRSIKRAIIQKEDELIYYDTQNLVELNSSPLIGLEYLFSMVRNRFLFTNSITGKNEELISIGSVINEPVRLLSYKGNRYQASIALASTFLKNMNYDNDGILRIGFTDSLDDFEITDDVNISISSDTIKYNQIEWDKYHIKKNKFDSVDNDDNTNLEEDENNYDASISIEMWANKDINMNITVKRIDSDTIKWDVTNNFTEGILTDTITTTSFDFFSFFLTGDYSDVEITCNFYNTELGIGEKFSGQIVRRELESDSIVDSIESDEKDFLFIDKKGLSLTPNFLYKLNQTEYKTKIEDFFISGGKIKKLVIYNVVIPELILFNENFELLNIGNTVRINSDIIETNGWRECYIESIIYDFKNKQSKLKLIHLE